MEQFPEFKKKHGPAIKCRPATAESIRVYKATLPAALINEWREDGWCGFAEGLIWIVNPSELTDVLADWLEPGDTAVAIARTAFGDLILWNQDGACYLDVIHARIFSLTDDPEILFDYILCRDDYLNKVIDQKLYRKALQKLGVPNYDECYAFEPAIALGGPGTVATLAKRKLREYLAILAQIGSE